MTGEVAITSPADGSVVDTLPLGVSAAMVPSEVTATLRLELDGAEIAVASSASTITASVETLSPGPHTLRAIAVDEHGHRSEDEVTFSKRSEPPAVAITSPRDAGFVAARRLLVTGTATDDVAVTGLEVSLDGTATPVTLESDGSFAVTLVPTPGVNAIVVTATDAEGQTAGATVSAHFGHRLSGGNSQGALLHGGTLFTWGRNELGQLGNGTLDGSAYGDGPAASLPVRYTPAGASGLVSVVTRQTFMIALRDDGAVLTWGSNSDGQLGYAAETDCGSAGTSPCRRTPTVVPGISGAVAVAAGFNHSLVLLGDGTVLSFGQNTRGALGYATPGDADQLTPAPIPGLSDVVQVAAGSTHSLAVRSDGTVWAWGDNQYGILGDGTADTVAHPTPTLVPGLTDVVMVASSNSTVLALRADGTVMAWGRNNNGQIGNDTSGATPVTTPTQVLVSASPVVPLTDVESVAADGFVSLAVTSSGDAYAWGLGGLGQLGMGYLGDGSRDLASRSLATRVAPPGPASEFVILEMEGGAGGPTFALTDAGNVLGWGWSFQGSLGLAGAIHAWAYSAPVLIYPRP
ncbi:Ig-like domain-containing protein [Sandaracinus amylolyticus]|uniref:RCC1 domain-containing protein n=1 Tax=Sandaracinus amylolyticus TaxID=927083 RepID=UPI001F3ACDCB|nr:Ig-like domain-containing protein [Sandaracinus amylolyticus]